MGESSVLTIEEHALVARRMKEIAEKDGQRFRYGNRTTMSNAFAAIVVTFVATFMILLLTGLRLDKGMGMFWLVTSMLTFTTAHLANIFIHLRLKYAIFVTACLFGIPAALSYLCVTTLHAIF